MLPYKVNHIPSSSTLIPFMHLVVSFDESWFWCMEDIRNMDFSSTVNEHQHAIQILCTLTSLQYTYVIRNWPIFGKFFLFWSDCFSWYCTCTAIVWHDSTRYTHACITCIWHDHNKGFLQHARFQILRRRKRRRRANRWRIIDVLQWQHLSPLVV